VLQIQQRLVAVRLRMPDRPPGGAQIVVRTGPEIDAEIAVRLKYCEEALVVGDEILVHFQRRIRRHHIAGDCHAVFPKMKNDPAFRMPSQNVNSTQCYRRPRQNIRSAGLNIGHYCVHLLRELIPRRAARIHLNFADDCTKKISLAEPQRVEGETTTSGIVESSPVPNGALQAPAPMQP
jgi:hypothetical protein